MGAARTSDTRETDSMCEVIGIVRDEMTPKIDEGGVSFTLRSRDYKGVMAVVISKDNHADELGRITDLTHLDAEQCGGVSECWIKRILTV